MLLLLHSHVYDVQGRKHAVFVLECIFFVQEYVLMTFQAENMPFSCFNVSFVRKNMFVTFKAENLPFSRLNVSAVSENTFLTFKAEITSISRSNVSSIVRTNLVRSRPKSGISHV